MQISHEIFSRKFPSSLLIFRKRLFKNENLGDYCRNFMISPAQSSSLSLSLSSSLSSSSSSLGSLSNDNGDGDGYENVTSKVNSRCFQLYRAYSISFNSSNVGIFFWRWILKDCIKVQEKKKKAIVLCSRPLQNVKLGIFTLQLCGDGNEMYKKAWCTCRVVVLPI